MAIDGSIIVQAPVGVDHTTITSITTKEEDLEGKMVVGLKKDTIHHQNIADVVRLAI